MAKLSSSGSHLVFPLCFRPRERERERPDRSSYCPQKGSQEEGESTEDTVLSLSPQKEAVPSSNTAQLTKDHPTDPYSPFETLGSSYLLLLEL